MYSCCMSCVWRESGLKMYFCIYLLPFPRSWPFISSTSSRCAVGGWTGDLVEKRIIFAWPLRWTLFGGPLQGSPPSPSTANDSHWDCEVSHENTYGTIPSGTAIPWRSWWSSLGLQLRNLPCGWLHGRITVNGEQYPLGRWGLLGGHLLYKK